MSKRRMGLAMMIVGIAALAAGLCLGLYNLWDDQQASVQAEALMRTVAQRQELGIDGDELELDGYRYIGTISIPAIAVSLPVQEDWSPAQMKVSPCRYVGWPNQRDFIICGHNYAAHFGRLKNLLPGDEVVFSDWAENRCRYTVLKLETLDETAVEEMESGDWDLTLFTCTLDGRQRVTVRCGLVESIMGPG